ncbi:MAG: RNA methyltransferase, partial [Cyanobacteria bacterium P01_H01_bin.121]
QTKERRQTGRFLLEGTHLIQEAIAVNYPLEVVCATATWIEHYPQFWRQLQTLTQRAEPVSHEVLNAIATTVTPDGVVATAIHQSPRFPPLPMQLGLAVENLQDPGNLGTLIRTAAATGVEGLWLVGQTLDLTNPKVLRASAGQWFRLPIQTELSLPDLIQQCQRSGMQVLATTLTATTPYWDVDLMRPTLILVGNEGAGLSEQAQAMADTEVMIPLQAGVESLNVAIATALILYEVQRQRR